MKKKRWILILILITMGVIAILNIFVVNKRYIPKEGFVPNEETAVKIAEAVWFPIYGEIIYNKQPFVATYNSKKDTWTVTGSLSDNTIGGVPEITINKSDGRIIYVNHGK